MGKFESLIKQTAGTITEADTGVGGNQPQQPQQQQQQQPQQQQQQQKPQQQPQQANQQGQASDAGAVLKYALGLKPEALKGLGIDLNADDETLFSSTYNAFKQSTNPQQPKPAPQQQQQPQQQANPQANPQQRPNVQG